MNDEQIAIRASGVCKTYRLWGSPRDRLIRPLKRIFASLLPTWIRKRGEDVQGFREFHALHDVSFEIRKGESWGFIGVNGSGKSTLLQIVSGNLRPSAGTVEVEGKVAILDYGSGFNGEFTGRENIYIKGTMLGLTRKQLDERVKSIEEFADIGEFIDQPVKTYSSGMKARLGFSIMMNVDAEIMISDEALAVGDAFFVQKCMRHIRLFLKRGTFIFVSHSINDVMSLCDHAVWLEHGRVVRAGKAKEVCRAYLDSIVEKNAVPDKLQHHDNPPVSGDPGTPASTTAASDNITAVEHLSVSRETKVFVLSKDQLAELKNHYAPQTVRPPLDYATHIDIVDNLTSRYSQLEGPAIGGGHIFDVSFTDENGRGLSSVIGGEIVNLTIRGIAEKNINRPLLGFLLQNHMGLALVGENTDYVLRNESLPLVSGEIVSAKFTFAMPLLAAGSYVIRAAFHDGNQVGSVAIDIVNEALLIQCCTVGDRHGLAGIPMLGVELIRENHALSGRA